MNRVASPPQKGEEWKLSLCRTQVMNAYTDSVIIYCLTVMPGPSYCLIKFLIHFLVEGMCSNRQMVNPMPAPSTWWFKHAMAFDVQTCAT